MWHYKNACFLVVIQKSILSEAALLPTAIHFDRYPRRKEYHGSIGQNITMVDKYSRGYALFYRVIFFRIDY